MHDNDLYNERVSSDKTEAFFVFLTLVFFALFIWRRMAGGLNKLAVVFLGLSGLFLFYALNYRTLTIRLTARSLKLKFGLFTWKVPLDNIAACRRDDLPFLPRLGGAGIHFMLVRQRYRASFNFLEHPRVVIAFKRKVGPVQELSFSTRRPDELLGLIQEAVSASSDVELVIPPEFGERPLKTQPVS